MKRLKREGVALTELRIAVCTKLYQIQKVTEYEVLNKQSIKGIIKVMQTSFPLPALKIHANSQKDHNAFVLPKKTGWCARCIRNQSKSKMKFI